MVIKKQYSFLLENSITGYLLADYPEEALGAIRKLHPGVEIVRITRDGVVPLAEIKDSL
jgi:hypothetical protein